MILLYIMMKIAYLVIWLIITEIISNIKNNTSFLIKSIKIEFYLD